MLFEFHFRKIVKNENENKKLFSAELQWKLFTWSYSMGIKNENRPKIFVNSGSEALFILDWQWKTERKQILMKLC